jgi:hypothetical protein
MHQIDIGDYNYFLRNDTAIRYSAGMVPHVAYSLFRREPYGRVHVLAGPLSWAKEEAIRIINEDRYSDEDILQLWINDVLRAHLREEATEKEMIKLVESKLFGAMQ